MVALVGPLAIGYMLTPSGLEGSSGSKYSVCWGVAGRSCLQLKEACMNQQVLARKWRPTTFDQLIGQDHVRKALSHALESGRLHHAYLFTGTRGVGKTTIARILARCLNCEQGVSSKPCGECGNCSSITDNRFVDLIEVDAASRTKIDDTRELLENVSYAPSQGRYKVFLIDEVHMLSTHSFNALLKTLEEPPSHVIFLLATTDPQKLLPTVLSRCLQFHLRDLSPDLIALHLEKVLSEEQIKKKKEALWHLSKAGRGSVRDAMTLLDQAIAHGEGQVKAADVIEMLGTQGLSEIPDLLKNIALGDSNAVLEHVSHIARETPDWMTLVSGLQSLLHQVAITQITDTAVSHLSPSEQKAITELATLMAPEFVQLAYQFTLTGYRDLPLAGDARSAFEMLILRMIAFRPARSGEYISDEKLTLMPSGLESTSESKPIASQEIESHESKYIEFESKTKHSSRPIEPKPISESNGDLAAQNTPYQIRGTLADKQLIIDTPVNLASPIDERVEATAERVKLGPENWVTEYTSLKLHGMTESLIAQTVLLSAGPEKVVLATNAHTMKLLDDMHQRRIGDAFAEYLGEIPEIIIEARDNLPETPEEYRSRGKDERLSKARQQFDEDPFIAVLKERFGGSVQTDTIEPRDGETHV